jgi:hypothetical protein
MWAFFYSFTIFCVVAAALFLIVDKFEPNRRSSSSRLAPRRIARQLVP